MGHLFLVWMMTWIRESYPYDGCSVCSTNAIVWQPRGRTGEQTLPETVGPVVRLSRESQSVSVSPQYRGNSFCKASCIIHINNLQNIFCQLAELIWRFEEKNTVFGQVERPFPSRQCKGVEVLSCYGGNYWIGLWAFVSEGSKTYRAW